MHLKRMSVLFLLDVMFYLYPLGPFGLKCSLSLIFPD